MVSNLVGARRGDQWDEPLGELAPLHQDVGGSVAPAGLEPQRECAVLSLLESFARKRWSGDVAAEPLETSPVTRRDGDVCVKAHAAVLGHAF